jgi:WD40 repeat protein
MNGCLRNWIQTIFEFLLFLSIFSGDWIAFGCSELGQLLVWEWQSETYVLKQQGHFNNMASVSFSPDATVMATGGQDGKVSKLSQDLRSLVYHSICYLKKN